MQEETSSEMPAETMGKQGAIQADEMDQIMSLSPPPTVAGERATVVVCAIKKVIRGATDSATMKQFLLCSQP